MMVCQPLNYRMSCGQMRARPRPWQGRGNSPGGSGKAAAQHRGEQKAKREMPKEFSAGQSRSLVELGRRKHLYGPRDQQGKPKTRSFVS